MKYCTISSRGLIEFGSFVGPFFSEEISQEEVGVFWPGVNKNRNKKETKERRIRKKNKK